MSELPERKVLKEMLLKLKTRVINSQKLFFRILNWNEQYDDQNLRGYCKIYNEIARRAT